MPNLAGDFFRSTVKPTVDEFLTSHLDIRRGRLAAIVLYHMADYWTEERHAGKTAKEKHDELQKLHKELIGKCPGFQLIRDVADASKHAKLNLSGQKTIPRGLSSSDQITVQEGLFNETFGSSSFVPEITGELDDGTKKSLIESVRSVLSMWQSMLTTP
ncbi:hypothetical protein [Azospirillum sp. B4]|uniref:hypothetical protein n=1 Tax=Azospirillum sp. B4 TaxID=95605 RepID=UPI0009FD32A5|nr:hypothetical protein [Azospirillum sp. B4]